MLTAGEVVNRIKAVMAVQGVQWSDGTTRDRFKFGGPDTVVVEYVRTAPSPDENVTAGPGGIVYRWDTTQPSPVVELVGKKTGR